MKYDPAKHKRRSIRLKGYDYSQAGLYFITICVQDREMLLGEIKSDEMLLNDAGKMVETEWGKLLKRFNNISLHEFVIMPNHFHAILEIVRATLVVAPNETAPAETGELTGATTRVAPTVAPTTSPNDTEELQGATTRVAPTVGPNETSPNDTEELQGATTRVAPTVGPNETAPDETGELPGATTRVAPTTPAETAPAETGELPGATTRVAPTVAPTTADDTEELPGATTRVAPTVARADKTIGDMMGAFKSITTVEYINGVKNSGWPPFNRKLWQRNYYEHIIRNERAYENISANIINNPARWQDDKFHRR